MLPVKSTNLAVSNCATAAVEIRFNQNISVQCMFFSALRNLKWDVHFPKHKCNESSTFSTNHLTRFQYRLGRTDVDNYSNNSGTAVSFCSKSTCDNTRKLFRHFNHALFINNDRNKMCLSLTL